MCKDIGKKVFLLPVISLITLFLYIKWTWERCKSHISFWESRHLSLQLLLFCDIFSSLRSHHSLSTELEMLAVFSLLSLKIISIISKLAGCSSVAGLSWKFLSPYTLPEETKIHNGKLRKKLPASKPWSCHQTLLRNRREIIRCYRYGYKIQV